MKKFYVVFLLLGFIQFSFAQEEDEKVVRQIFDNVLESNIAYENLRWLCDSAPGRLLGSENSYKAIDFMKAYFESMGADTVFLQEFTTPAWIHHKTEVVFGSGCEETMLDADALGPSASTPKEGIEALVLEVQGLEELQQIHPDIVKDKIVFFNRPFDQKNKSFQRLWCNGRSKSQRCSLGCRNGCCWCFGKIGWFITR